MSQQRFMEQPPAATEAPAPKKSKRGEIIRHCFFDIETGPAGEDFLLKTFEPEFAPDARLKDADKIAASIAEKREAWLGGSALRAERARIIAIGYCFGREGEVKIAHGREVDVLEEFETEVAGRCVCERLTLCGFNALGFDLPMIRRRRLLNELPCLYYDKKNKWEPWKFAVYDAMKDWASGDMRETISLDTLARALGVGKKNGSGADFAALYESDREKALDYLRNDIALTRGVCLALNKD